MSEPVHVFWAVVAVLVVAAAWNHGWHHVRDRHVTDRLVRASTRDGGVALLVAEPSRGTFDADRPSGG